MQFPPCSFSWISCSGRSQLHIVQILKQSCGESMWWGIKASNQQPCKASWNQSCSPMKNFIHMSPTLSETLSQNHPTKLLLNSYRNCKIINVFRFKPLHFGVIYYAAIDNGYIPKMLATVKLWVIFILYFCLICIFKIFFSKPILLVISYIVLYYLNKHM